MATGDLLYNDGEREILKRVLVPPEDAAAEALAIYLARQKFTIHAGTPGVDELSRAREFCLEAVTTEWPKADARMAYPSATIIGGDDTVHAGGLPVPLEQTFDDIAGTVAWHLGVASGTFQVDFWSDSIPTRQAIAARLPGLFSPSEDRAGILLELSPHYLCLAARFTLMSKGRQETADTVWAGEHRLRAVVGWEVPDVELRRARQFRMRTPTAVETA